MISPFTGVGATGRSPLQSRRYGIALLPLAGLVDGFDAKLQPFTSFLAEDPRARFHGDLHQGPIHRPGFPAGQAPREIGTVLKCVPAEDV